MKKLTITFIIILAAIYAALAIFGGGGEYAAEKLLYRAVMSSQKVIKNPDVAPPALTASIEQLFLKTIKTYPKSVAVKSAHVKLAEFYIATKNYNKAFSALATIAKTYPKEKSLLSTAQFLRGIAYEKQDKWTKAVGEFIKLRDTYTDTQLGLEIPMYIAKHYVSIGAEDSANKAFTEASLFYERVEGEYRGKMLGYAVSGFMVQSLLAIKDYAKAGTAVERTIDNYLSPMTLNQYLPYVDYIYIKELKQPEKAIAVYEKLKGKSKDKKFTEALDKRIAELKKQRQAK